MLFRRLGSWAAQRGNELACFFGGGCREGYCSGEYVVPVTVYLLEILACVVRISFRRSAHDYKSQDSYKLIGSSHPSARPRGHGTRSIALCESWTGAPGRKPWSRRVRQACRTSPNVKGANPTLLWRTGAERSVLCGRRTDRVTQSERDRDPCYCSNPVKAAGTLCGLGPLSRS